LASLLAKLWKCDYGRNRSGGGWGGGGTMYTHVSKCKNDKIKGERIKNKDKKEETGLQRKKIEVRH
jgi:hypothetical protein